MKPVVYVVLQHIPYEGIHIVGIFANKEDAEAEALELSRTTDPDDYTFSVETYLVKQEFNLGE